MIADVKDFALLQRCLSSLAGFSLALYSRNGETIFPPVNGTGSRSIAASFSRETRDEFIHNCAKKALLGEEASFHEAPWGGFYLFLPLRVHELCYVIVGEAMLPKGNGERLSLSTFKSSAQDKTLLIRSVFDLLLRHTFRENCDEQRWRQLHTALALLADTPLDKGQIMNSMLDIAVFLFNPESLVIMSREDGALLPQEASGVMKESLMAKKLPIAGILSDVVENRKFVFMESAFDILSLGFPGGVSSVYVFPIIHEGTVTGTMNLFNTVIPEGGTEVLELICRVTGRLLNVAGMNELCQRYLREMETLNSAAARIIPVKDPEMLYEAIVEASVHLTEAEKGSLMLANDDMSLLTIRAAKGIHPRFFGEIKARSGEGVAGWVFREGVPLKLENIDKNDFGFKRKYRYKTGSFVSVPLKSGERTLGVLNISDKAGGGAFSEEDMALLCSFASYVALALERSTYYSLAGQLKELSITDSLTDLFNRRYFEERFFEELHRSERHNLCFSLLMIDIDDFKTFNDTEGHLAGDEVLKRIAAIAKDCVRVSDVFARFGGEEFAVIMPQTEKEEAYRVAERIRETVRTGLSRTWTVFPKDAVTVSIGVATYPIDGTERKELIRNADRALYMAKMKGKDMTVKWEG